MTTDGVGHLMDRYLNRTQTFVYTLLRHQTEFRPVVLTKLTENLDEFPFEPIHEIRPTDAPLTRRVGRRLAAKAQGFRDAYDYTYTRTLAAAVRESGCVVLHAHFGQVALSNLSSVQRVGLPLVTSFYRWDIPTAAGSTRRLVSSRKPLSARALAGPAAGCGGLFDREDKRRSHRYRSRSIRPH